ncbi:MAG: hypothetical protein V4592_19610 [Bacteroidota bacterium]
MQSISILSRKCKVLFGIICLYNLSGAIAQQNNKLKKSDSILVEKLIHKLNLELIGDNLTKKQKKNAGLVDSLLNEYKEHYNNGNVMYSPDKSFKIVVIDGDGVGGTVYNLYTSFIYFPKKSIRIPDSAQFFPVIRIYQLNNHNYLVLHAGLTGSGNYLYNNFSATLFAIKNNQLIYSSINYGASSISPLKGTISITQNQFIMDGDEKANRLFNLVYNAKSKNLSYSYISQPSETQKPILHTGSFVYSHGTLIFQKETKRKMK